MDSSNPHALQAAEGSRQKRADQRLDQLKEKTNGSDDSSGISKAARKFESLFINKVFKRMQKASPYASKKGFAEKMYRERFTEKVSKLAAKEGGFGLAEVIEDDWADKHQSKKKTGSTNELTGAHQLQKKMIDQSELPSRPQSGQPKNSETRMRRPEGFAKPVDGDISSEFGYREHPVTGDNSFHDGTDIAAPHGSTIQSSAPGRVTFVGEKSGYGKTIEVEHPGGWTTSYAHASDIDVEKGEWVSQGQKIGEVGSTGRSTGPHLHFELKRSGRNFDPTELILLKESKNDL